VVEIRRDGALGSSGSQPDGSLWDKLCDDSTIWLAWLKVRRNRGGAGVDGVTVRKFESCLERNLRVVQSRLPHYQPLPYLRRYVRKSDGKVRGLDIPCVRDRLVLRAMLSVLAPLVEPHFPPNVFGFRCGIGAQAAVQRAEQLIREGRLWAFRSDIEDFFSSIDRSLLMRRLCDLVLDNRVLSLIDRFLNAGTKDGGSMVFPHKGIAQGSCLSPLLSNVYLSSFDASMLNASYHMLRYGDDILVLSKTEAEALMAASTVRELLAPLGLALNKAKTSIAHLSDGIEFLGFVIGSEGKRPSASAVTRLKHKIEYIDKSTGANIYEKIMKLRRLVLGWLSYFGIGASASALDSLSLSIVMRTRRELQDRGAYHSLPRQLRAELVHYFEARRRLEMAGNEVCRIGSTMYTRWQGNPLALRYLRKIFSHG